MKIKLVAIGIMLIAGRDSYALSQCPSTEQDCGTNPFAAVALGFSQVCTERQPENAKYYEKAVEAFFEVHSREYEQWGRNQSSKKTFKSSERSLDRCLMPK